MDKFFSQQYCDRCGGSLKDGRFMSKFNTDCICIECKQKEKKRSGYKKASDAELEQVKQGNYNFPGVGLKDDCPHGGDIENDCADCAYSDYHYVDGECVERNKGGN